MRNREKSQHDPPDVPIPDRHGLVRGVSIAAWRKNRKLARRSVNDIAIDLKIRERFRLDGARRAPLGAGLMRGHRLTTDGGDGQVGNLPHAILTAFVKSVFRPCSIRGSVCDVVVTLLRSCAMFVAQLRIVVAQLRYVVAQLRNTRFHHEKWRISMMQNGLLLKIASREYRANSGLAHGASAFAIGGSNGNDEPVEKNIF